MKFKFLKQSLVVAAFGAFSSVASAGLLVGTFEGNDCPGEYGPNFSACVIPANTALGTPATPSIIKFEFNNGEFTVSDISTLFPTITGNEFSFDFTGDEAQSGTWTYTPGPGDPGINFFAAKGGTFFNLFQNVGDMFEGDWFTPINPSNQQPFGLSHLTFYDTMIPDQGVPEPASLALLGLGLAGLAFVRRRRR